MRKLLPSLYAVIAVCGAVISLPLAAQTTIHVPADQPTIQAAIDAATTGSTVLVSPGTYYENIDFKGKAITVTGVSQTTTIIDGKGAAPAVTFQSLEMRNSVISNFTIRNGRSSVGAFYTQGGVYVGNAAPSILNNIITSNYDAAIAVEFGAALIQGNILTNTLQGTYGSQAVILLGGNAQVGTYTATSIIGNAIQNNFALGSGVISMFATTGTIIQSNIINGNTSSFSLINAVNTDAIYILNNLIYGNVEPASQSAISILAPGESVGPFFGVIASNTLYENGPASAPATYVTQASQLYLEGNLGQYVLVNNIIVGNTPNTAAVVCGQPYNYLSLTPLVFDHNDIYAAQGSTVGGACGDQTGIYGNLSVDPAFNTPLAGDFTLRPTSPVIDMGNTSAPLLLSTDLAGAPRVTDATGKGYPVVDMGAYESAGSHVIAPTLLTLTPSSFAPYTTNNTPFSLTAAATSTVGVPAGSVTFYQDGIALGTLLLDLTGKATLQPTRAVPGIHAYIAVFSGLGVFPPAVSVKFFVNFPLYGSNLTLVSTPNASLLGQAVTFTATLSSTDGSNLSPITLSDTSNNATLATLTPNSSGVATYNTSSLSAGYHYISATYAGDSAHESASAFVYQQVVNPYSTVISATATPNPAVVSTPVTLTASVTSAGGSAPTGSVTFSYNNAVLGTQTVSSASSTGASTASIVTSSLPLGYDYITVTFTPTGSFTSSTNYIYAQIISGYATTTTVTSSVNPSIVNQSTTFAAHLSSQSAANGTPTGSVVFKDGTTTIATQPLDASGNASFATSALTVGTHSITATLVPTGSYAASSGTLTQQVNSGYATSTSLSSSLNPSNVGQPVTFTAYVGSQNNAGIGPPTGSVTFSDGSTALATIPLTTQTNGNQGTTYTTAALGISVHAITATYTPTGSFSGSNASLTQTVRNSTPPTGSVTVSPEPGVVEQDNLVFTAAFTPPANEPNALYAGTVVFSLDGATVGTATLGGGNSATFTDTSIHPAGTHTLTAVWSGDTLHSGTTFTGTHIITTLPVALTLSAAATSVPAGQPVTLTTAFTPAYAAKPYAFSLQPQSSLSYYDNGTLLMQALHFTAPTSTVSLTNLAPGQHVITVSYPGDTYFSPSTSQSVTINVQIPVTVTLTPTAQTAFVNSGVTFAVSITPINSTVAFVNGIVSDFVDGQLIGTTAVVASSNGTFTLSNLTVGTHTVGCTYSGDNVFAPGTCNPATVTVVPVPAAPTMLTLSASVNPSIAFTQNTFTATLTTGSGRSVKPVQGAIIFTADGAFIGTTTTNANGAAVLLYSGLTAGTHTIAATYAATTSYLASAAQLTEAVTPLLTSTVLTVQPNPAQQGQTVTIVATIAAPAPATLAPAMIGTVQFLDGATLLGNLPVQTTPGAATQFVQMSINTLAPGTHSLTAVYTSTNASYIGSTSAAVSLVINPSDFNLSTTSPTLTLKTEHHGDLGVTLTSIGGLTGRFTLTCGSLPYPASGTFGAVTVNLPASGSVTSNLHIDTDAVLGFKSSVSTDAAPLSPRTRTFETMTLATLLPLGLLALTRRRKRLTSLASLAAAAVMLLASTTLTGCGDKYPDHVAPGTYAIRLTATGTPTGGSTPLTRTTTFTLVVTE